MARFTITVVLRGGSDQDLDKLSAAMERGQFTRSFRDAAGKFFEMPPGSFNFAHPKLTAAEVRNKAAKIAAEIGRPFELLVTEAGKRHCLNLRETAPPLRKDKGAAVVPPPRRARPATQAAPDRKLAVAG